MAVNLEFEGQPVEWGPAGPDPAIGCIVFDILLQDLAITQPADTKTSPEGALPFAQGKVALRRQGQGDIPGFAAGQLVCITGWCLELGSQSVCRLLGGLDLPGKLQA